MDLSLSFRVAGLCCVALFCCSLTTAQESQDSHSAPPAIELNVNRLLVPVVARDKQGHATAGLTKSDFQVFDNDKPHPISGFTVERRSSAESAPDAAMAGSQSSVAAPAAAQADGLPARIVVFLFDDLHMSFDDLAYARKAGVPALAEVLSGPNMAAVVCTSGKINSGLTRDPAKLQSAIANMLPRPSSKSDCPDIDYYQADQMLNKHNSSAAQDALAQTLNCNPGINPQTDIPVAQRLAEAAARRALDAGALDVQTTFANITEIVRRMAKLPGQRTLILVSSGFLATEPQARTAESQLIEMAAQSNVTISALDSRGLFTTSLTASEDVHQAPVLTRGEFRASAAREAENALGEIADGAGGTFFHNSNDLDEGFKLLTEAPEIVYILELSLDGIKPDGTYHRLRVNVDREGVDIQARRGYFMPKPEKNKK
jgi:VWFA-related protein